MKERDTPATFRQFWKLLHKLSLSFSVIAGETLSKGQAVYISGSSGGTPIVAKADNTNATKSRVVGLMAADTFSGTNGIVRRAGVLRR